MICSNNNAWNEENQRITSTRHEKEMQIEENDFGLLSKYYEIRKLIIADVAIENRTKYKDVCQDS